MGKNDSLKTDSCEENSSFNLLSNMSSTPKEPEKRKSSYDARSKRFWQKERFTNKVENNSRIQRKQHRKNKKVDNQKESKKEGSAKSPLSFIYSFLRLGK